MLWSLRKQKSVNKMMRISILLKYCEEVEEFLVFEIGCGAVSFCSESKGFDG